MYIIAFSFGIVEFAEINIKHACEIPMKKDELRHISDSNSFQIKNHRKTSKINKKG